ncbi:MAG: hypothetical protein AABY32_01565 [Nanoarchaeota archaeon]
MELRRLGKEEVKNDTFLLDLPIVCEGNQDAIESMIKQMGLKWVSDNSIYGGYWVDTHIGEKTCYLPT